jgi:hypothetical protein
VGGVLVIGIVAVQAVVSLLPVRASGIVAEAHGYLTPAIAHRQLFRLMEIHKSL